MSTALSTGAPRSLSPHTLSPHLSLLHRPPPLKLLVVPIYTCRLCRLYPRVDAECFKVGDPSLAYGLSVLDRWNLFRSPGIAEKFKGFNGEYIQEHVKRVRAAPTFPDPYT